MKCLTCAHKLRESYTVYSIGRWRKLKSDEKKQNRKAVKQWNLFCRSSTPMKFSGWRNTLVVLWFSLPLLTGNGVEMIKRNQPDQLYITYASFCGLIHCYLTWLLVKSYFRTIERNSMTYRLIWNKHLRITNTSWTISNFYRATIWKRSNVVR